VAFSSELYFFAVSLTPTLLPRSILTQGVLSGWSLAAGYGVGVFARWLWGYVELPQPEGRRLRLAKLAAATCCAVLAVVFFWRAARWQNSIRDLMQLEPVDTVHPFAVVLIALAVFAILMALARLFQLTLRFLAIRVNRVLPRRASNVVGVIATVALFWAVISGVLFRVALRVADASFQEYDELIGPETEPPTDPLKTGSSASRLRWEELGRAGREFISSGPTRAESALFRVGKRSSLFVSMSDYDRQTRRKLAPSLRWTN
jgi:uncharacterized membrane protein